MSGFVDLQVNGYAGVDFNADDLTDQDFVNVCDRLSTDGVESILATVITSHAEQMIRRIVRIAQAIETLPDVARVIAGIHVEGPFLSPIQGFVGAHPVAAVCAATSDQAQRLVDAGRGHVRLVTLAPEQDAGANVTRNLVNQGIKVAAGHSDATLDQLKQSIDAGLSLFTHLGNACPAELPRHDNIINRVLSLADQLSISLIADGHHLPTFLLQNMIRLIPDDNLIIVSDAISAAGLGAGNFRLGDQIVHVDQHGAAWSADRKHFAGSAATMNVMHDLLKSECNQADSGIHQWMVTNPKRFLN